MGALTVSHRFGLLSQVWVRCGPPVVTEFLKKDPGEPVGRLGRAEFSFSQLPFEREAEQ